MPKMTKNQMQGRLAELQISRIFVRSGHSVNEFKDSDFGIDLHVQFSEKCDPCNGNQDSWDLSSNSIYIQVKSNRRNASDGYPPVRVSVASMETWFAGTKAGNRLSWCELNTAIPWSVVKMTRSAWSMLRF